MGFLCVSAGKESACNVGDLGSIPRSGRSPGEAKWQLTPLLLPEEFHGQQNGTGCSPWNCKESDTTV